MNVKYFYGSFWQWTIFLLNVFLVHFCFYSSSGAWGSRELCISFVCLSLLQLKARLRFALASFLLLAQFLRFYSLLLPSMLLLFLSLCLRHDVRKGCWAQFCCPDSVSDAPFRHRTLKPAHSPAWGPKLPNWTPSITVRWGTGRYNRPWHQPSQSIPIVLCQSHLGVRCL